MTCECKPPKEFPFYCERHKCWKNEHWHHLCQTNEKYRVLWDQQRGPGQPPAVQATMAALSQTGGAGTELQRILHFIGLRETPGCPCARHIRTMNAKGVEWCAANVGTITGWLRREAKRRKLPFFTPAARRLVLLAISRAKKRENRKVKEIV